MLRSLTNVFSPARFQGGHKRRRYFEGYYLKIVDPQQNIALALIPGVSYDAQGEGHAFVQVLDGVGGTAHYHRFGVDEFDYATTGFSLAIAGHHFSEEGIECDLPGAVCSFSFRQNTSWPSSWYSPGAMGPFAFVPGMECRHGVVSLHHQVCGSLNGRKLSQRAVGYIEKDWGRSFPNNWVWMQSNHLGGAHQKRPSCLMVSAGRVPFAGTSFQGFIAALLLHGKLYRFTTYNGARMSLAFDAEHVDLQFSRKGTQLRLRVYPAPGVELVAPQGTGGMIGRVNESLQATAVFELSVPKSATVHGQVEWLGFEVGGDWPAN